MIRHRLRTATAGIRRLVRAVAVRLEARATRTLVGSIVDGVSPAEIRPLGRTRGGTRLAFVDLPDGTPAFIKAARLQHGVERLKRENAVLVQLHRNLGSSLRSLVPLPIELGAREGWTYLLVHRVAGEDALPLMTDSAARDWVMAAISDVAADLHAENAVERMASDSDLAAWIDRPFEVVDRLQPSSASRMAAIADELRHELALSRISVGVAHGDLWPANVLVDTARRSIVGIVDWDSADYEAPAFHDQLHLLLYSRKLERRTSIGQEIRRLLEHQEVASDAEARVLGRVRGSGVSLRSAVVLYWARLVAENLARQPSVTESRGWIKENVTPVLAWL